MVVRSMGRDPHVCGTQMIGGYQLSLFLMFVFAIETGLYYVAQTDLILGDLQASASRVL